MLKDKIFTYLQQYKSKKNLFKNLLIQLLISKSTIKKLSIIHLLFFIPVLHAETKHCYFLDRLNCENCPAPLMFKCGSEIKFASSTASVQTVQAEFTTLNTGIAGADTTINSGNSRGAHRFDNVVNSIYKLKSPPDKIGDLVENLNRNTTNHITNTEEWAFQKITAQTGPTVTMKRISQAQISYHIDEDDLNVNPEEEGFLSWLSFWEKQDKTEFCYYNSVPQILNAKKCRKKFCLADIKCRKNDTILTHKYATCKAIGPNYDRCPQAIDCIRKEGMDVTVPIGYFNDKTLRRGVDLVSKNNLTSDYGAGTLDAVLVTNMADFHGARDDNYIYTFDPQLAIIETASCKLQFCIADIQSRQTGTQLKVACLAKYNKRCPENGQLCLEEQPKGLSMRNAKNVNDLMGISLLAEVKTDSDRDIEIKEGTGTTNSNRRRQRRRSNDESGSLQ